MPPKITIETKIKESAKVKLFGATYAVIIPYKAPARPATKLPKVKATRSYPLLSSEPMINAWFWVQYEARRIQTIFVM